MNAVSKKIVLFISLAIFAILLASIFFISKKNQSVPEEQKIPEETDQPIPLPPPSISSELEKKKQENKYQPYKQEQYSYGLLKNSPNIIGQAKELMNDFSIDKMAVSTPVVDMKLDDGREVLLLSGCEEHNCGGTGIIIAYDKAANKVYLLTEETGSSEEYKILGNPDDEIKNLLIDYYKNG
ncbi:MAG: Ivy family c-type lysozyme inhibitor [Candidatus Moranbacteria bacterium]|nr:Ivy family c-type lysozyme inhibitor [Candidatus Moranbacteria bacterium]